MGSIKKEPRQKYSPFSSLSPPQPSYINGICFRAFLSSKGTYKAPSDLLEVSQANIKTPRLQMPREVAPRIFQ